MFGDRLKEARKNANMTLDELAEKYNKAYSGKLSKGTLSKYENNKQEPMFTVVTRLAAILNVSVDTLCEFSDEETELAQEVKVIELVQKQWGNDAVSLLNSFVQLNDEGKKKALDIVSDYAANPKYKV